MDVAVLSPVGEAGGAEHLLLDVLEQLRRRGHTVRLVALGPGPLAEVARDRGIEVHQGPALSFSRPASVRAAVRSLRTALRRPPDVLLLNHPKAHLLAVLARAGRRSTLLLQVHDPVNKRNVLDRLSYALDVPRVANSAVTARSYAGARSHQDRVPVVSPGVDVAGMQAAADRGDADAVLAAAGLTRGTGLVVMVARLQAFKGPATLVEVAARLVADAPGLRCVVVGPDAPAEPGLREELLADVRRRGLSDVVGLAGFVERDDLAAALRLADCLVHPAREETFGLVLVEAMAVGTPVVACRGPGPDLILGEGGGSLVPHGDVEAMTAAVRRYLEDPTARARDGAVAAARALVFDAGTLGAAYETLARLLLLRSPGAAH